ncbi:hypothetical protein CBM2605_A240098 [Cupriavidus neocaledonicus]|uniref:Uncharacterized protein n=1 Tax=Cupriavidus neocaledonicus TaxID=1040979 RepID=A0ABY1V0T5_9BURK|nr:hypothetical protein CBM2605_A240098 [Cupriavidus neocaledonicus]
MGTKVNCVNGHCTVCPDGTSLLRPGLARLGHAPSARGCFGRPDRWFGHGGAGGGRWHPSGGRRPRRRAPGVVARADAGRAGQPRHAAA